MPDLETSAVQDWLRALQPGQALPDWPPPIRAIEAGTGANAAVTALGQELDRVAANPDALARAELSGPAARDFLRDLLCQLGAARMLRLLQWLTEHEAPGATPVCLALTEGASLEAAALRSAVGSLSRRLTLQRIFSAERIAALRVAMTDTRQEAA